MAKQNVKFKANIQALSQSTVFDENNVRVTLQQLWKQQTCVFIFLRHFACIGCRSHAVQVWLEREKYEASGAKLIFIGNGTPDFIRKFKEDLMITEAIVYTDPSLGSFRAAGFKRGFLVSFGPKSIVSGVGLMLKTGMKTSVQEGSGDLWQMGGILVVRSDGKVPFHYISEAIGDYPPESDVITE